MARVLIALLLLAAPPPAERSYELDPARSTVRYHIIHKFHDVTGTTSTIEAKAVAQADGKVLAMVRVPMASFDSGERNRDADMREAVEARRFPFVVFKGVAQLAPGALDAAAPTTVQIRMEGEVELHGVTKPVAVPLTLELGPGGAARARGSFTVSLDGFGVKRPSLLFVKIDDACKIEFDLSLQGPKA